jgi:hypothetical protein
METTATYHRLEPPRRQPIICRGGGRRLGKSGGRQEIAGITMDKTGPRFVKSTH